jgi:anion-transporting  ArsA/GET3 family ATPase
MDIGSIFLILALLVLVGLFISRPFFERGKPSYVQADRQEDHEHSFLLAERDRLLNALQELDFDYDLRKVPEEEYAAQRAVLLHRGADVLRRLDAQEPQRDAGSAEDRIEAAIAARRAVATAASVAPNGRKQAMVATGPDDALEALLADRRRVRQEKAAGFCSQCGGPVQKSDKFCPKCGAKTL